MRPCHVGYHGRCFKAGPPFTCRRRTEGGLHFPHMKNWPLFICECCTVRAVVGRELGGSGDLRLLAYERMRILDLANSWTVNTYSAYGTKLSFLNQFEAAHAGMRILARPSLDRPPTHESVALAWAELEYSLRDSPKEGKDQVSYNTIRQIRSAAGWHHSLSMLVGHPRGLLYDRKMKVLTRAEVCVGHDALMSQFSTGLKNRIGTEEQPSWALLDRHVRAIDAASELAYQSARTEVQRRFWATAGLANLVFWLGWLRSMEAFELRWKDITNVDPLQGPQHDLPPNMGCLLLKLKEGTKSSQSKTADVPLAFTTRSGYQVGKWYRRLHRLRLNQGPTSMDASPVFCREDGVAWDSHYFRTRVVYPVLHRLRDERDPYLVPLTGENGDTVENRFCTLHMYRRGARSHCDVVRDRSQGRRKASPDEVYEHARWRRSRAGERIDVLYRAWNLWERLQITLCCM